MYISIYLPEKREMEKKEKICRLQCSQCCHGTLLNGVLALWCQYLVLGFVLLRMQSMYIKEPKRDGTRIQKRVFPCHTSQEWSTFTCATCVYILCLASVSL